MLTLVASFPVRAEFSCSKPSCKIADNPLQLSGTTVVGLIYTVLAPFILTSEATTDGFSKHYTQAVKDDAAAYIATDGDFNGPMLESAWRAYLEQHAHLQPSKKEFAYRVLAINS
ncbi:hypothetical protein D3C87_1148850 [compost metagenome]